jgi:hypothetical protein
MDDRPRRKKRTDATMTDHHREVLRARAIEGRAAPGDLADALHSMAVRLLRAGELPDDVAAALVAALGVSHARATQAVRGAARHA